MASVLLPSVMEYSTFNARSKPERRSLRHMAPLKRSRETHMTKSTAPCVRTLDIADEIESGPLDASRCDSHMRLESRTA